MSLGAVRRDIVRRPHARPLRVDRCPPRGLMSLVAPTLAHAADLAELLRAPVVHIRAERRPGRTQRAHCAQVANASQIQLCLHAVGIKRGAGTEKRDTQFGREPPQRGPVRRLALSVGAMGAASQTAVENAAGGTEQQAGDLDVPHHPAGRAVPVVPLTQAVGQVTGSDVVVQADEPHRNQRRAAMAMHDGFWQSGRAAGIDDPQRMIERHAGRFERPCLRIVATHGLHQVGMAETWASLVQRSQLVQHEQVAHGW